MKIDHDMIIWVSVDHKILKRIGSDIEENSKNFFNKQSIKEGIKIER